MNRILLLVLMGISSLSYGATEVSDTIDFWHVKRNGKIIIQGDVNNNGHTITITKARLVETDMFEIIYHSMFLPNNLMIQNQNGEIIEQLQPFKPGSFKFKTKLLQKLSHQEAGGKLIVTCTRPMDNSRVQKLFTVEVK